LKKDGTSIREKVPLRAVVGHVGVLAGDWRGTMWARPRSDANKLRQILPKVPNRCSRD